MIRRLVATEKTLARFGDKPFDWRKAATCIHMLGAHARNMGHRGIPVVPQVRSALGAVRALKAKGHDDLTSLLDSMFVRISPAMALMGDVALMGPDEGGLLDAIVIVSGDGKVLGWSEHDMSRVQGIDPVELKGVWRL